MRFNYRVHFDLGSDPLWAASEIDSLRLVLIDEDLTIERDRLKLWVGNVHLFDEDPNWGEPTPCDERIPHVKFSIPTNRPQ